MVEDSADSSFRAIARQCDRELVDDESLGYGSKSKDVLNFRRKEKREKEVGFDNFLWAGRVGASADGKRKLGDSIFAKGVGNWLNILESKHSSGWPGERNFKNHVGDLFFKVVRDGIEVDSDKQAALPSLEEDGQVDDDGFHVGNDGIKEVLVV